MVLLGFLQDQIQSPFCHALALAKPPLTQTFLAQMQLRPCSSRVLPVQPTEVGGRPNLRRDPCSPIGSLVGVALNQKDSPVCHSSSVSSATQVAGVERRWTEDCVCVLVFCMQRQVCAQDIEVMIQSGRRSLLHVAGFIFPSSI